MQFHSHGSDARSSRHRVWPHLGRSFQPGGHTRLRGPARNCDRYQLGAYVPSQLIGAVIGTWTAHLMFSETILQLSTKAREAPALWFAEGVATFGLILTILGTLRWRLEAVPFTVGLYIASAYWFTASTSFANPAVTVARSVINTFAAWDRFWGNRFHYCTARRRCIGSGILRLAVRKRLIRSPRKTT